MGPVSSVFVQAGQWLWWMPRQVVSLIGEGITNAMPAMHLAAQVVAEADGLTILGLSE